MKLLNKYLITFLASGLIIIPALAAETTNVDVTKGTGNGGLINLLINSNQ